MVKSALEHLFFNPFAKNLVFENHCFPIWGCTRLVFITMSLNCISIRIAHSNIVFILLLLLVVIISNYCNNVLLFHDQIPVAEIPPRLRHQGVPSCHVCETSECTCPIPHCPASPKSWRSSVTQCGWPVTQWGSKESGLFGDKFSNKNKR